MRTTYFFRTTMPLDLAVREKFEAIHHEATGNSLAVLPKFDGSECLVKVTTERTLNEIMPNGFVASSVITDIDEARALLASTEWRGPT